MIDTIFYYLATPESRESISRFINQILVYCFLQTYILYQI